MRLPPYIMTSIEIVLYTGRSDRYARHLLYVIRKEYNKPKYAWVTKREFCDFMRISLDELVNTLKQIDY